MAEFLGDPRGFADAAAGTVGAVEEHAETLVDEGKTQAEADFLGIDR